MTARMLLDTSSLVYRAFFALPATITAPDGTPVNALRGYLDMTTRLLLDHRPGEIVHCFDDAERPDARVAAYPGYKAQRAPAPDGLPEQFARLPELLAALGHDRVVAPGWEADDVIATLCADGDGPTDVVTGDRDLIQLVRDTPPAVRVLFTVKGVSELACYDEAGVRERYGLPAHRYVDFAALRGDPSDGLPGVVGVGEKTALALVSAFDDIPSMLADLSAHPPGLARKLDAARDYLEAMRAVVPVRRDVPVQRVAGRRDDGRLDDLARRWNLEAPVRRHREATVAVAGMEAADG